MASLRSRESLEKWIQKAPRVPTDLDPLNQAMIRHGHEAQRVKIETGSNMQSLANVNFYYPLRGPGARASVIAQIEKRRDAIVDLVDYGTLRIDQTGKGLWFQETFHRGFDNAVMDAIPGVIPDDDIQAVLIEQYTEMYVREPDIGARYVHLIISGQASLLALKEALRIVVPSAWDRVHVEMQQWALPKYLAQRMNTIRNAYIDEDIMVDNARRMKVANANWPSDLGYPDPAGPSTAAALRALMFMAGLSVEDNNGKKNLDEVIQHLWLPDADYKRCGAMYRT